MSPSLASVCRQKRGVGGHRHAGAVWEIRPRGHAAARIGLQRYVFPLNLGSHMYKSGLYWRRRMCLFRVLILPQLTFLGWDFTRVTQQRPRRTSTTKHSTLVITPRVSPSETRRPASEASARETGSARSKSSRTKEATGTVTIFFFLFSAHA